MRVDGFGDEPVPLPLGEMMALWAALIGLVLLVGCVEPATEGVGGDCTPGDRISCTCPHGGIGLRVCQSDGFFTDYCGCDDRDNRPGEPDPSPSPEPEGAPPIEPDHNPDPSPKPDPPLEPDPTPDPEPDQQEERCYWEDWGDGVSLSGPQGRLRSDWRGAATEAMEMRWPPGAALMRNDPSMLAQFGEPGSWSSLMESLGTVIHEGTHIYDYGHANWETTMAYFIRDDLTITTPWIDGFNRSEIRQDLPDSSTNLYGDLYLTGEQGARGFSELMDEQNCYINDMIAAAVVGDQITSFGWSARDGSVSFLLYMQLYFRRARLNHPQVYDRMRSDPAIQELVLIQWLRTHFWLEISDRYENQGIRDAQIRPHIYTSENLDEMARFLGFPVSESPCY